MAHYLISATKAWKRDGMPGAIPKDMLEVIRKERFKNNEFTMHFPYHEWNNRNLMLNQQVDIDMPLVLSDVLTTEIDEGV